MNSGAISHRSTAHRQYSTDDAYIEDRLGHDLRQDSPSLIAATRRRSFGQSVEQVVDHHLATRLKSRMEHNHLGQSPLLPQVMVGNGYHPSFGGTSGPREPASTTDRSNEAHNGPIARPRMMSNPSLTSEENFVNPKPGVFENRRFTKQASANPHSHWVPMKNYPSQDLPFGKNPGPNSQSINLSRPLIPRGDPKGKGQHRNKLPDKLRKNSYLGLSHGPVIPSFNNELTIKRPLNSHSPSNPLNGTLSSHSSDHYSPADASMTRLSLRRSSRPGIRAHNSVSTPSNLGFTPLSGIDQSGNWKPSPNDASNTLTLDNWFDESLDSPGIMNVGQDQNGSQRSWSFNEPLSPAMELRDIDEMESALSSTSTLVGPRALKLNQGTPFTLELATGLRMLLFGGTNRSFTSGWWSQSFEFHSQIRLGLVQHRGGPCGILAAVEAHLIQCVVFGSPFDDTTRAVDPLSPTVKERERALAVALVWILHRCSSNAEAIVIAMPSTQAHFSGIGRYKEDGVTETFTRHELAQPKAALAFIEANIGFFTGSGNHGVVAFLFSALLTRGFSNVRSDMDSPDLPLVAAHGYCSQEMVHLLLCGEAISNTFDHQIVMGDEKSGGETTILKGMTRRLNIGLLSLFEHYQSIKVGDYLKSPTYPIWLLCSESHFSVIFGTEMGIQAAHVAEKRQINLLYFDGLAQQDTLIRLTLDSSGTLLSQAQSRNDEDLVPPLEHCLRTKWPGAKIDWNNHQKIL